MSGFTYDPVIVKDWAQNVIKYLNGEGDSINTVSRKFNSQIEKLVQPNVWTGTAAAKNYQNFMEAHTALINFINSFGAAFENAMNNLNINVGRLEEANLGSASSTTSFGTLSYEQLNLLSEENINKDIIRYDYNVIVDIGSELSKISTMIDDVKANLKNKINELNSGAAIWDGNAAEKAKNELADCLSANMVKVKETLNICIGNITKAAIDAQGFDN